ncbi:hypothetical protein ST47_g278 [Ascochyta rabiei]|uniref:Uncharacterized protein n=1 Tax=Didymella rabiei TaxID=5454 RepID=A0A163MBR3_DIDRA|nr:hypothetical protein ST47_g278 [Ascochyta rabiei]
MSDGLSTYPLSPDLVTDYTSTVNDARAMRIAEIMTDFRNLQHYLSQLRATPTAEEYYLEGYSLLRSCASEAQTILQTPFSASTGASTGDPERERQQLKTSRTQAIFQRYSKLMARCEMYVNRLCLASILLYHPSFFAPTAAANGFGKELLAITDTYVESTLRSQDTAQGKWLAEDPSLSQIQQQLMRR